MKKNILIVADQMAECLYLKEQLQEVPTDIFCTSYIDDTVNALTKSRSLGLLILEINCSFTEGLEHLELYRRLCSIPILVIAPSNDVKDKVLALELGADDYLAIPYENEELIARIKALLRRYLILGNVQETLNILAFGKDLIIDPYRRLVEVCGQCIILTKKEFDILFLLASRPGWVFTKEQIYEQVWHDDLVDNNGISCHIKRIRKKLFQEFQPAVYLETVYGVGYKFVIDKN